MNSKLSHKTEFWTISEGDASEPFLYYTGLHAVLAVLVAFDVERWMK